MSVNKNISEVQRTAEEKAKAAERYSKRVELATLGAVGLVYDAGMYVLKSAEGYFHKAEERGQELESAIRARRAKVQQQMTDEAKAKKAQAEEALNNLTSGIGETGKAIENKFQQKFSSLKTDEEAVLETEPIQIEVEVEIKTDEPWVDYESLNVQEVIDGLTDMDLAGLQQAYEYEASHKNRVTVLREIELKQAALEEEARAAISGEATAE